MKTLFLTRDSLESKISYYHILCLMASLPFDRFYSHLILISFGVHTLIQLNKKTVERGNFSKVLILQSVFFVTVLSTIYTINRTKAFTEWGKHVTILILPLLLWLNPIDLKKYRHQLLLWFALVCTATIIYLYLDAFRAIRYYGLPLSAIFSSPFTNHNFSQPIDMHATFFSMQVAISLVYLLSLLVNEKDVFARYFYLACCAILSLGLVQLCSKSVFIALIIVINIALPYFLMQGSRRRKLILISASLSALLILAVLSEPAFRERYINDLKTDLLKKQNGETTGDSRLARWSASVELIDKAPLIGHGSGSEIGLLQTSFFNRKMYSSYLNKLNTHNQYLSFLIKSGAIGLLIYLLTLAYGFKNCFIQKDLLFFTFLALTGIVSISENLLDVDKGIFFYAFFFSFFIFSNVDQKEAAIL